MEKSYTYYPIIFMNHPEDVAKISQMIKERGAYFVLKLLCSHFSGHPTVQQSTNFPPFSTDDMCHWIDMNDSESYVIAVARDSIMLTRVVIS